MGLTLQLSVTSYVYEWRGCDGCVALAVRKMRNKLVDDLMHKTRGVFVE